MPVFSFAKHGFTNRHQQKPTCSLKLIVSLLLITESVLAQGNVKNLLFYESDKTVYSVAEQQPEFPGGTRALVKFLRKNLNYPRSAASAGISGRVFVSFVINTDGSLTDVQVLKGIGFGCDEEAVRVMQKMPRWKPGKQSGRAVRVRYNLPISFPPK